MARKKSRTNKRKPSSRRPLHSPAQTSVMPTAIVPVVQNHAILPLFQQAIHYFQSGNLKQAESICHNILQLQPNHSDTLHLLGIIATQFKKYDTARQFIEKAIKINNSIPGYYGNLGNVLKELEKFDEAIQCYQQVLTLVPNSADAYYNLGIVFRKQEKLDKAIEYYQKALVLNPQYALAYYNLGNVFFDQQKLEQAIVCYQNTLAINPNYVDALNNLGLIFENQGNFSESINYYQQALTINPNHVNALNNLSRLFYKQGKFSESINCCQKALSINPNHIESYNNLGNIYKSKGAINKALQYYEIALSKKSEMNVCYSNFLLTLNYSIDYNRVSLFKEHKRFNEIYAQTLAKFIKPYLNERNLNKKLRIGYNSQDFRKHSVAYFIEPILAHHNHEAFEIYCYYSHTQNDEVTQRLKQYADKWIDTVGLSDEEMAEQIRQDKIDIMVDLMGHTGMNRILVFARKPAPIQMTYLGYSNTTGLTAIDYHLTDKYADPEGIEPFNSETIVRMSHSYFCYSPSDETCNISVKESPCILNKYITFGSFNVRAKLSPTILKLWSKLLKIFPNSKLFLKNKNYTDIVNQKNIFEKQQLLQEYFGDLGVDFEQVIIEGHSASMQQHLEMYHKVDIALDSFPYNGATTTCEALWMGVPVVTLVGDTHVSRMGLSILSTLGLEELIAYTPEEYVAICVKLANNLNYLQQLRSEMRERMLSSPLMDGQSFTRELESHYQDMWHKWCQS